MAQLDNPGTSGVTSFNTAAAATVTVQLPAPGATKANRVVWAAASATTATVAEIQFTKNDGTTMITRIGGVGTTALSAFNFAGPSAEKGGVVGVVNDAMKVILVTTGGTLSNLSVHHELVSV